MTKAELRAWLVAALLAASLILLSSSEAALKGLLGLLFPGTARPLYPRAALAFLVGEHLGLVAVSSLLAALVGISAGILATRPGWGSFAELAERLAAAGQTFPPAAALALAVPSLGFGFPPTIVALFLYGILPIVRNTMSGLAGVGPDVLEAARGMGMGRTRILFRIELPLAAPLILAGLRTSVIVNIGTATIGATIGAGGLGAPIISGLVTQNPSYLAEGAMAVALLALAVDALFAATSLRLAASRALSRAAAPGP
jgi:osmoprotectant transport system permease protein